ncbi:hypothetical protein NLG97_g5197 [Lecanicillium saksenae]|uniref:Uncharacterized protein n=1 Tax=Lecanicillium saksenae TaxID=468837 RepID=A0ACC1QWD1_9HYPO|nr:hypothetical protein NLG97_g5197 [Lecanicillium saksenae]
MKVSVAGLALASLCGSAFAAPVNVNADANVGTAVDATANANINGRDGLGNVLPVEGATGDLTNVDGLKQKVTGVLGSTGGVLGRSVGTDGLTNVEGLTSGSQLTDAQKLANLEQLTAQATQLVQQLKGSAGGVAARDITANVDAVVGKLVDAKVDAVVGTRDITANVDAVVGKLVDAKVDAVVGTRDVTNTVADADSTVKSATDVGAMDTVNSVSPDAKQTVDQVTAKLDNLVDGLSGRDVVGDVASAAKSVTGTDATNVLDATKTGDAQGQVMSAVQDAENTLNLGQGVGSVLGRGLGVGGIVENVGQATEGLGLRDTVDSTIESLGLGKAI